MAGTMNFADRMSQSDALMWTIESDPQLRSTITTGWVLDRAPDWERFERKLERCTREIPRLRQKVVADPLGLAPPRWEIDPHFDLRFHLRRISAPGAGTFRDLLELAEPIGMQGFDRDRPLWELICVEGLEDGRVGLIMKLHHAVSDGVGLVRMTEGLIERTREPSKAEAKPLPTLPRTEAPSPWQRLGDAIGHRARTGLANATSTAGALLSGTGHALRAPLETARALGDGVASLGRMLAPVSEPLSLILRGRSMSVHFDVLEIPLDELKRAARAADGTLNDAFVAAVTGGLRRYHEAFGTTVPELRMNMPINMRSGDHAKDAGNQFAPVRFAVPVDLPSPVDRMRAIHRLVLEKRQEPAIEWLESISGVIGQLPGTSAALVAGAMMKAIDFTTSNVPGPRFPVHVSGAKVERMFGFGPLAGAAINVTCFSYDGVLAISINTDPAAVEDPALFTECLRKGFDEVLAVV